MVVVTWEQTKEPHTLLDIYPSIHPSIYTVLFSNDSAASFLIRIKAIRIACEELIQDTKKTRLFHIHFLFPYVPTCVLRI